MAIDPNAIQKDASALAKLFASLLATGPDGVEAGIGTSEFWLSVMALGFDIAAPSFHWVSGVTPTTELAFATLIAAAYTFGRSLRKKYATAPVAVPAPAPSVPTPPPAA